MKVKTPGKNLPGTVGRIGGTPTQFWNVSGEVSGNGWFRLKSVRKTQAVVVHKRVWRIRKNQKRW